MRALTYHGPKDVRIDNVDDPTLQQDDDIILRVTATAICGSDLHLYRGKIPATEQGDIFGHEFMGIVEEAGPAVTAVKKGDRVVQGQLLGFVGKPISGKDAQLSFSLTSNAQAVDPESYLK